MRRPLPSVPRSAYTAAAVALVSLAASSRLWAQDPQSAAPPPVPAGATPIRLPQALDLALARNWTLLGRSLDVDVARASEEQARSVFDPTFSLDASASDYRGGTGGQSLFGSDAPDATQAAFGITGTLAGSLPTGTGLSAALGESWDRQYQLYEEALAGQDLEVDSRYWNTRLTLGVSQHLLRGLGPAYNLQAVRQAQSVTRAADLVRAGAAQSLAASVVKGWLDLAYAARALDIAQLALERARDQREVARARIEVGDLAPIEVYKFEETVAAREGERLQAEVATRQASLSLRLLLAPPAGDPLASASLWPEGDSGLDLPARDPVASQQEALSRNADIAAGRESLKQRRILLAAASHERLPYLDLQASLTLNGYRNVGDDVDKPEDGAFHSTNHTVAVGATLTVPLGGRATTAAWRQRRAEVEKALTEQQALEAGVVGQVEAALLNISALDEQVRVAKTRVESARKSLEAESARFQVGKTTTREVLDTQAQLREAELLTEKASVDARKARVELEVLRGTLLDALGIELR